MMICENRGAVKTDYNGHSGIAGFVIQLING